MPECSSILPRLREFPGEVLNQSMGWEFHSGPNCFEDHRSTWDALNQAVSHHILLDSGFVSPLLKHFGDSSVILGVNMDNSVPGMTLLTRRGPGLWETFQPSQAPIGLLLFDKPDPNGEMLLQLMRKLPGFALELSVLQQDLEYSSVPLKKSCPGLERLDYIETARITLKGTFEEYWRERGTKLRNNISRRRRRMIEGGYKSRLVALRAPHEVKEAIREYGRLESSGWKGKSGTAVSEENCQGRFYRDVFEHFCERREAAIYQLRLDDKVVASDLCLMRNGMMIVLKTAYDESLEEYAPALLMREEIMREIFEQGSVRVVEFYGRAMDWHTRFSSEIRSLYHINCLRFNSLSTLRKIVRRFK